MPTLHSYDYAILRLVPCPDRGEFVNAGVVLHCPERAYLQCRVHLNEQRLAALWPEADADVLRQHLHAFPKICAGDADAGPIAKLSRRERFHWLVAPRSTMIQVSPVHSGVCDDPDATIEDLFRKMVLL